MKEKALLINPPAPFPVMRDYYCTSVSKAGYVWHPAEFLFQSGVLSRRYDVEIIDAVAEKLSEARTLSRVGEGEWDLLLGLVGSLTEEADIAFLRRVPAKRKVVSGEVVLPRPAAWLEKNEGFDGAMSDFTTNGLLDMASGATRAVGLAIRSGRGTSEAEPSQGEIFRIPRPKHELFSRDSYRMPLQKHRPFASLLTDFGCPYQCQFCNSGGLGHRRRAIQDVAEELEAISRLGFKEIFIKNMSFASHKAHAKDVLALLAPYRFSWHAYARLEDLDGALMSEMAASGCHLIQVGIEHISPRVLRGSGKGHGKDSVRLLLKEARDAGVDLGLHWVLGLPGEDAASLLELEDFVAELSGAAYISVNLFVPRRGSPLEKKADGGGGSRFAVAGRHDALSPDLPAKARARIHRRFYFRPRRIMKLAVQMPLRDILSGIKGLFLCPARV